MSENNLSTQDNMLDDVSAATTTTTTPPPPPLEADDKLQSLEAEAGVVLTDAERELFKTINKDVSDFVQPKNFLYVIPNLLRGFDTKFVNASEDAKLAPELKTEQLLKDEAVAAKLLKQYGSEYALLFSATEVKMSAQTVNDWKPLHVPQMFGRAKILLIHVSVWSLLQDKSFIVRHHRSMLNPETSEVYEIYVMSPNGAALEYVAGRKCTACQSSPAPFVCNSCKAPYCSDFCRMRTAIEHEVECIRNIMEGMKMSVERGRTHFNQTVLQFNKEQAEFEERNRGKLVTVQRIDREGNVISETQEVVVPAAVEAST